MTTRLIVDDVSVEFRSSRLRREGTSFALRGVSLVFERGETIGLVGESGSGKTTLGQVLVGLQAPTGGRVTRTSSARRRKGDRQLVGQNPRWALNPRLRVWRSVAEPLAIAGASRKARRRAALDSLEAVGLTGAIANRFPHQLSGGQLQRAAIARALIGDPEFVVFDEAVSALDVSIQVQTINIMKALQRRLGFTSLFISHDLPAVRYAADRVGVLYRGELVHEAPVRAFYEGPLHPYSLALQHADDPDTPYGLHEEVDAALTAGRSEGCVLVARCPFALDVCSTKRPAALEVGDQRSACHRADEMRRADSPAALVTRQVKPT